MTWWWESGAFYGRYKENREIPRSSMGGIKHSTWFLGPRPVTRSRSRRQFSHSPYVEPRVAWASCKTKCKS